MPPNPYILPAGYQVLAGNHGGFAVDAAGNTFWPLNVKKDGGPLYFMVWFQPQAGDGKEALTFKRADGEVGQGKLSFAGQELWASAFRSPTDAVSPPLMGKVAEYVAFPAPPTAGQVLGVLIERLGHDDAGVTVAVERIALGAVGELRDQLLEALAK